MTRAKDDRMETEAAQHGRQEATWRDECLRLRAQVASLTASRVFVTDSDGGRYVECPAALSDHLDHLEQRAKGAETALLKCQREIGAHVAVCGPVSETEAKAIGSMIAGAAKMMAGEPGDCEHPADQCGLVCAVCDTWLDEPATAADVVEIHAETILRVVGYCLSDGPRSALADCGAVLAFVAKATA